MVRTQIYLTEKEHKGLKAVSKATGMKQSELIREAVDQFLDLAQGSRRQHILKEAAGIWGSRQDLPDYSLNRRTWDRD